MLIPTLLSRGALLLLALVPLVHADTPRVVASIAPIHSLVAGVMEGVAEPTLLIRGGQSPHSFGLRPSDARALHRAQLVIWVGEALELPLENILRSLPEGAQTIALLEQPELELLTQREDGEWGMHDHHQHGHEHHRAAVNPHLWLSPANAAQIVRITHAALNRMDPANADRYRQNSEALLQRIDDLDLALQTQLQPLRQIPYLVFHDAYHYLEHRYGLNAVGSVTLSAERAPGARRLRQLQGQIGEARARCIFSEPQFEPRLVNTLIQGTDTRAGTLDPLGADLQPGPSAYFQLMHRLGDSLHTCLAR